jgi:glycosyltransferase involved in cell wall biosynthesis
LNHPVRVSYLLTAYPTISETFVEGEFRALRRRGIEIDLYATRNFREILPGRGAENPQHDAVRLPYLLGREPVAALVFWILRRPLRTLSTLARLVTGNLASPRYLLHALALFPKSLSFARRIRARGSGHVHATWGHYPATSAWVISRLTDTPFSFSAHAGLDVTRDTTFQAEKIATARFVLACNQANGDLLRSRNPRHAARIRTVYHGVDLSAIPAPGSIPRADPPEILSIGRLAPEKGFLDLLRACGFLKTRGTRFFLRIIGAGPQRETILRAIREAGLRECAALDEPVPHRRALEASARATVVALASYRHAGHIDGIPNVLVEAMACGTPVVSTDHPGARELLKDGGGLLVPQRDPERLAGALESLLRDPALGEQVARAGRRRIEQAFDRERNIEQIAALFLGEDPSLPRGD